MTPARLAAASPVVCGLPIWAAHLAGAPDLLAAAAGLAAVAALTAAGATTLRPHQTATAEGSPAPRTTSTCE